MPGLATGDINLESGETVTCTFTNTLIGTSGLSKVITASDQPTEDPGPAVTTAPFSTLEDVAIGEILDFEITVDIPFGTYDAVTLVDTMEEGLAFYSAAPAGACFSVTGINLLTLGADDPCVEGPANHGYFFTPPAVPGTPAGVDDQSIVTFQFGDIDVTAPGGGELTVTFRAVVLDSDGNIGLPPSPTQLTNEASLHHWVGIDPGVDTTLTTGSVTVEVVEPQLQITKTAVPTLVTVGTEVTYTLTIQHTANSQTPAYEVEMFDPILSVFDLPVGPRYDVDCSMSPTAPDNLAVPTPPYIDNLPTDPNTLHVASWSVLDLGDVGTCTIKLTVNNTFGEGQTIQNVAFVTWSSVAGDEETPRDPESLLDRAVL